MMSTSKGVPRVELKVAIGCDIDTQRYVVARHIHQHLWRFRFIVEQGVGSEVFFFPNARVHEFWKKHGHTDSIAPSVIQFIGSTGGFTLLHNTNIDQSKLRAAVMKARRANALPVHIYYERLAEIARVNKDEFQTSFTYNPVLYTWVVDTTEAAEGHGLLGGHGQTPEHACHEAMEGLPRMLSDWGYTNPFEGE